MRVLGGFPKPEPRVRGRVRVHRGGFLTGSRGPDEHLERLAPFSSNQVNAIWAARRGSPGSANSQGNVGHALWELPASARRPGIDIAVTVRLARPGS